MADVPPSPDSLRRKFVFSFRDSANQVGHVDSRLTNVTTNC